MNEHLQKVLDNLRNVKKSIDGWTARCPAHEDKRNSLTINEGDDTPLLLYCHAGCTFESIIARLDLSRDELSANKPRIELRLTITKPKTAHYFINLSDMSRKTSDRESQMAKVDGFGSLIMCSAFFIGCLNS